MRSDRFVLLGPSGCGKSTLLKAVGGYMAPVEGEIAAQGPRVTEPGPDRMMVFQEFDQLLPWKTVLQNVMFRAADARQAARQGGGGAAMHYIEKVGLTHVRRHLSAHAVGRHEAARRDRPRHGDGAGHPADGRAVRRAGRADARRKMQDELLQLWEETRFTVLFVTHSIPEAIKIGNRILLLSPHPGQVKAGAEQRSGRRRPAGRGAGDSRIHEMLFADRDRGRRGGARHA